MSAVARSIALVAALLLIAPTAGAEEPPRDAGHSSRYGLVSLQAQASREVANDLGTATLAVEAGGEDPAALAAQVNRRMSEALAVAKATDPVRVRTGGYRTHPVSKEGRIVSWRVSQELRLESADFPALARLIGRLQQQGLVVRGMAIGLAPESRRAAENALIDEAIAAFRTRADAVREALGARGYRIRNLDIGTGGEGGPRPLAFAAARAEAAPAALEPGTSTVGVTVSGTVHLQ